MLVLCNDESPRRSSGMDVDEEAIEHVDAVKLSLT